MDKDKLLIQNGTSFKGIPDAQHNSSQHTINRTVERL